MLPLLFSVGIRPGSPQSGREHRRGKLTAEPDAAPADARGDAESGHRIRRMPTDRVPHPSGDSRLHGNEGIPVRDGDVGPLPPRHGRLRGRGEGPGDQLHRILLWLRPDPRARDGAGPGEGAEGPFLAGGLQQTHVGLRVLSPSASLIEPETRRDRVDVYLYLEV